MILLCKSTESSLESSVLHYKSIPSPSPMMRILDSPAFSPGYLHPCFQSLVNEGTVRAIHFLSMVVPPSHASLNLILVTSKLLEKHTTISLHSFLGYALFVWTDKALSLNKDAQMAHHFDKPFRGFTLYLPVAPSLPPTPAILLKWQSDLQESLTQSQKGHNSILPIRHQLPAPFRKMGTRI